MIEAGVSFCYNCGSTFRDAFYKSGAKASVCAVLRHPKIHLKKIDWELELFTPDGSDPDPNEKLTLLNVNGGGDGMPDSITVRYADGKVHEMKRCCPFCKDGNGKSLNTQLPEDCGRYRTFVIAMVGERTVGKTTWLQSIAIERNLALINAIEAYPYKLDFIYKNPKFNAPPGATPVGAAGKTNYLRIIEKATGKIAASVILLDAAGELYPQIHEPDCILRKFLFGLGEYPGVDALMYFESAMTHVDEIRTKEDLDLLNSSFAVYEAMHKAGALTGKPVAYVCTHTDEMLNKKKRIPKTADHIGKKPMALYTKGTFTDGQNYEPEQLLDRRALQDVICRSMGPDVLLTADHTRRGFMIQSCQDIKLKDGTAINDMSENYNLMDPLLWLLEQLRIFPIPNA